MAAWPTSGPNGQERAGMTKPRVSRRRELSVERSRFTPGPNPAIRPRTPWRFKSSHPRSQIRPFSARSVPKRWVGWKETPKEM
jgi:hypothetical protein